MAFYCRIRKEFEEYGYGLSYTTFNYGNIKLEQTIKVGETAKTVSYTHLTSSPFINNCVAPQL